MKISTRLGIGVLILAAMATGPAVAQENERGIEVGVQLGGVFADSQVTGSDSREPDLGYGGRAGLIFSDHWGWMLDFMWSDAEAEAFANVDAQHKIGRMTMEYLFTPHGNGRFFLNFGGGLMNVDYEGLGPAVDFERTFASVGLGQRVKMGPRTNFRWELRFDQSVEDDEGPAGSDVSTGMVLGSFNFGPGGKPVDSDGDGVFDRKDSCPNTPSGATVDAKGCPQDSDGDGVFDGIDRCPDTPKGWPVDDAGCPRDSDGDQVADGEDDCPNTPRGAVVDAKGCPKDSDDDGVADGIDKCPSTPKGARVDARGCPTDGDGDGVPDGLDKCPNTPKDIKVVDANGCATDTDGDGVPDGRDKCPNTPKGTPVNADGCEKAAPLFEKEKRTLILEGVYFDSNEATLTPNSTTVLDGVVRSLQDWPEVKVEVAGHTDAQGAAEYNQSLSERRAQSVREYMVSKGIDASRITARGYGESNPISDNASKTGRAKNRRVELKRQN